MKKFFTLLFSLLLLSLTGCSAIAREINVTISDLIVNGPESVTIEGVTYRRGFYGELLSPLFGKGDIGGETLQKEIIYDDGRQKYRRVDFEGHDWVHSNGGISGGVVYCAENQWEQMRDYYADPDNFEYYCGFGHYIVEKSVKIPEIDYQKFDELVIFGNENDYDLGTNGKAMQISRRLPEDEYHGGISFYKVSNDGYFTTGQSMYFVHDGKLLNVFFHDWGRDNGGVREVVVIDVPDELGQYFVDLIERYQLWP